MSDSSVSEVVHHDNKTAKDKTVAVSLETTAPERERANRDISKSRGLLHWFDPNDGPVERRLILKLDFYILTYACFGFWVLYIDRGILQNAYVSGMREDLNLLRNQFVQLNTVFTVGYASSMIPSTLLITRLPANRVIPTAMMLWGLFTLLCFQATSFQQLAGFRFLVGFFEGPFFCSIHYVIGSWYRPDEIVRRAGIFYVSSSLGTMTTGLLAARIYQSLNGSLGHPGWRWMYIVGAAITFPIAIWGYLTFPGTPKDGKRWILTQEEFDLAKDRMEACGRKEPIGIPFKVASFKRFLGRWHFWVLIPWNLTWTLGMQASGQGAHTLWLRSNPQYTTVQVNNFTAISPSLGIIWILTFSWIADRYGDIARVATTGLVTFLGIFITLAFVLYDRSPFSWKWFAVAMGYLEVSLSPLIYSWANIICAGDAEERAFITSSMLALSSAFGAWVPLLAWQTIEAPKYPKGYAMSLAMQPVYFGTTCLVYYMVRRSKRSATKTEV